MARGTMREGWNEFMEGFENLLKGDYQEMKRPHTNFEQDYGPAGRYSRTGHETDESTGSEVL